MFSCTFRPVSGFLLLSTLLPVCWGAVPSSAQEPPGPLPALDSPLAAWRESIYAVGEDGRSLLTRPIYGDEAWQVLARNLPVERIAGLAYDDDCLFFSDAGRPALWRLRLTTRSLDPVYQGFPLASTAELAIVDETEHLYVADVDQGRVYQLEADEADDQDAPPKLIDLPPLKGPIYLAGSDRDLIVTAPEPGAIYYLEREGTAFPIQYSARLFINISVQKTPEVTTPAPFRIASRARKIDRPGPVALYGGLIYVLNEGSGQTSVFSRHQPRPIYYPQKIRGPAPARFAATPDHLVRLDAKGNGLLQVWSRLIPAEVEFPVERATEAMAAIYSYLAARNLLPTRAVPLRGNLEATLKRERVLLAAHASELDSLLCGLNEPLCAGGRLHSPLEEGQLIVIPDLYSESTIDVGEVKLDGTSSLENALNRSIHNSELAVWKQEESIARLNSDFSATDDRRLLDQRSGRFTIPVELIHYVIGFPAREVGPESSQLGLLQKQFPGLTLLALQEKGSRPDALQSTAAVSWADAGTAYQTLLGTIHFTDAVMEFSKAAQIDTALVGVAEGRIAETHPAFQDGESTPAFEAVSGYWSNAVAPPAAPLPPSVQERLRHFSDEDHGTSVASLIGARALEFGGTGIASRAILFPLYQGEPHVRDELRRAALRGVKLFNVSHDWEEVPQGLYNAIQSYRNALFVVAAGQNRRDGEKICEPFMLYPACWSAEKNVLVVAGTTLDGSVLFPGDDEYPGSNYGHQRVHVAAPGVGFYAAGWGHSYVPVRGTSFATPLVTATAALLHEQGIDSAFKIKQRIIATADDKANLRDKVLGGLLNVELAVTRPRKGQVVDDNGQRSFVEVRGVGDVRIVRPDEGTDQVDTIPVRNLLRVSRGTYGYRVVYVADNEVKVVYGAEPEGTWSLQYYEVNSLGIRVGQLKSMDLSTVQDYIAPIF